MFTVWANSCANFKFITPTCSLSFHWFRRFCSWIFLGGLFGSPPSARELNTLLPQWQHCFRHVSHSATHPQIPVPINNTLLSPTPALHPPSHFYYLLTFSLRSRQLRSLHSLSISNSLWQRFSSLPSHILLALPTPCVLPSDSNVPAPPSFTSSITYSHQTPSYHVSSQARV